MRFSGDPGIAGSVEVKHCLCKLKPRSRLVQVRRRRFERGSLEGLEVGLRIPCFVDLLGPGQLWVILFQLLNQALQCTSTLGGVGKLITEIAGFLSKFPRTTTACLWGPQRDSVSGLHDFPQDHCKLQEHYRNL